MHYTFVEHETSLLAECARETVQNGLHQILNKRALSGLDVDVGRHARTGPEIHQLAAHVVLVRLSANDERITLRRLKLTLLGALLDVGGLGGVLDTVDLNAA